MNEMFYLTMPSTHFIYSYIASDSERGNSLPPPGLLFPISSKGSFIYIIPTHDNTFHSLCYTSRGALAGTRNSSMERERDGRIDPMIYRTISEWSYHGDTYRSCINESNSIICTKYKKQYYVITMTVKIPLVCMSVEHISDELHKFAHRLVTRICLNFCQSIAQQRGYNSNLIIAADSVTTIDSIILNMKMRCNDCL